MRPMSVREMDALCYERGIEFDPAEVPLELAKLTHGVAAQPAWDGRSLAQELDERRAADGRQLRKVPERFWPRIWCPSRGRRRRPKRCEGQTWCRSSLTVGTHRFAGD